MAGPAVSPAASAASGDLLDPSSSQSGNNNGSLSRSSSSSLYSRMGRPRRDDWAIIGIFLASLFAVYLALGAVTSVIASDPAERHWVRTKKCLLDMIKTRLTHAYFFTVQVSSLAFNLLGYSTVFLPGYLIIQYVRKSGYLDQGPPKCMDSLVS